MEPQVSLSCSQYVANGPYPEPVESNSHPHVLFPQTHWTSKLSVVFRFCEQNFVPISHPFHARYMPRPSLTRAIELT